MERVELVLATDTRYRLPEPTRVADKLSRMHPTEGAAASILGTYNAAYVKEYAERSKLNSHLV